MRVGKRLLLNELRDVFPMNRGGTTHWVLSGSDKGPVQLRQKTVRATGPNIPGVTPCRADVEVEMT